LCPSSLAGRVPCSNARRLHELGYASAEEAERFATLLDGVGPEARFITPLVTEIIARRA
jgi:hypothetical protein